MGIHERVVVPRSAKLGEDVNIGPFCVLGEDVVIGKETTLHCHVTVESGTVIGEGNQVYPYSSLGAMPHRKKGNRRENLVIGSRNKIRENVVIEQGTVIGNDNMIMVASMIAQGCEIGNNCTISNQCHLAESVRIEDGANLGGGVIVHHFVTVGTCAFVSGLSRITKDVPPFMIVDGNPAEIKSVNTIAMERCGFSQDHINKIKEVYRFLFRQRGSTVMEKLVSLEKLSKCVPAVGKLCDFLRAASNGVHGRSREPKKA